MTSPTSTMSVPAGSYEVRTDPVNGAQIECVPWSALGPSFISLWGYPRGEREPEHVEILGQTGSGKSWFEVCILLQRQQARGTHIVVVCTKPADKTMLATGWPIIDRYPPQDARETACIFWPVAEGLDQTGQREQARKIYKLLQTLWHKDANIIVVFDEIAYLCTELNFTGQKDPIPLRNTLVRYYREARGLGITIVATTQRPQGVPRQVHSESNWTICFAPKDEEDAERMAQVLGGKRTYKPILNLLNKERYEFLIVHNLTRKMYISWIDIPLPTATQPHEKKSEN